MVQLWLDMVAGTLQNDSNISVNYFTYSTVNPVKICQCQVNNYGFFWVFFNIS